MNLIELQEKFNTHDKCVKHLERVRWGKTPICPHCGESNISTRGKRKKVLKQRYTRKMRTPKYHCNSCNKDFTVLVGTIFEGTHLPLQKWFMLTALMLNARKGISAMNVMRDVGITYKTAWYAAMRLRCAMLDQADMLEGILEMDEVYLLGGKRRRRFSHTPDNVANLSNVDTDEWKPGKRGRGSENKVPVVGIVERGEHGRVAMKVQGTLKSADMLKMLKRYVKMDSAIMMTDDYHSYRQFDKVIQHLVVKHSKGEYVRDGMIHTNTIEGVWSIIKNGIRGQYHILSKKYLPFYLAEAAYKYNRRNKKATAFKETIENAVIDEKCEVNYKPKKIPAFLAYRRKKKKVDKRKKSERVSV